MGYRLRLLGRLALEAGPEPSEGAAARPRSLALLAILASGGDSGVPRDKLLLYLWPESNTQRARNSLHQALHTIRRHLGEDAVQAGALTVRLNPAVFSSDLWDFLAALDRGDVEQAVELYDGCVPRGLRPSRAPRVHPLDGRGAVADRSPLPDALEAAAARASREGRHRDAIERWQALARLDPLSSRPDPRAHARVRGRGQQRRRPRARPRLRDARPAGARHRSGPVDRRPGRGAPPAATRRGERHASRDRRRTRNPATTQAGSSDAGLEGRRHRPGADGPDGPHRSLVVEEASAAPAGGPRPGSRLPLHGRRGS